MKLFNSVIDDENYEAFRSRFPGEAYLLLACHAAFPVALTSDLLYKLWLNFKQYEDGRSMNIPVEAVGLLLNSSICHPVGSGIYKMSEGIQSYLQHRLQVHPKLGLARTERLARFLKAYLTNCKERLPNAAFAAAQDWRADFFLNPEYTARRLLQALAKGVEDESLTGEVDMYLSWCEGWQRPQTEEGVDSLQLAQRLATGVRAFQKGDHASAETQLSTILPYINVQAEHQGNVFTTKLPEKVLQFLQTIDAAEELEPADFLAFQQRYEYGPSDLIAQGGQAKIYKAYDKEEERLVAIKTAPKPPEEREHFSVYQEFKRAMAFPPHPSIPAYYDVYRLKTRNAVFDFGVMELVYEDGQNLASIDAPWGYLPYGMEALKSLLRGILKGLQHLHENGLIHGDLTLSNIRTSLKDTPAAPKIIDFGVSQNVSLAQASNLARAGTHGYMAPELLRPGQNMAITIASDLWSFGICLYRLLVGRTPFGATDDPTYQGPGPGFSELMPSAITERVLNNPIPREIETIPQPFQKMIRSCLIKDISIRSARVQSAGDLLEMLEKKEEPVSSIQNILDFNRRYDYDPNISLNIRGQGKVFKGRDNEEQIDVAIKRSESPDKKLDLYSVYREFIRAMKIPSHPNLPRYFGAYRLKTDMGMFDFGVMELIEGSKSLDDFMKELPTEGEIKHVIIGILKGLGHLHQNKIIHRDIKPNNILIDESERLRTPKIIDFGISKELRRVETVFSMVVGTVEYMAPEQLNPPKDMPIHPNTDLWAFGVILYRIFLNSMPFGTVEEGRNMREEIHDNILSAEIPADISKIPEPYQTIVRACLVKDVKKRFQTAQEIIDILEGYEDKSSTISNYTEFHERYEYDVNRPLREISMGRIYQAYDKQKAEFVAIKRAEKPKWMRERYSVYQEFLQAREVPPHPNLVQYFNAYRFETDFGVFDYGIMELIGNGQNLEDIIGKRSLSASQIKSLFIGIVEGLQHLHAHNIILRNLKPTKVLVDDTASVPVAKLIDFGISKELEHGDTIASMITPASTYLAPEQINFQRRLGIRNNVDFWALGVIIYELFTDDLPFGEPDDVLSNGEVAERILEGILPAKVNTIPEPYQTIIKDCLVIDPLIRVPEASEILGYLKPTDEAFHAFCQRYNFNPDTPLASAAETAIYNVVDDRGRKAVIEQRHKPLRIYDKYSLYQEYKSAAELPPHRNLLRYLAAERIPSTKGYFDFGIRESLEDAKDLQTYLATDNASGNLLKMFKGILNGLGFLHDHKIIHQGLSPQNILISRRTGGLFSSLLNSEKVTPKIKGYGLSRDITYRKEISPPNPYLAPEQAEGSKKQSILPNADLWAFGVIMYEGLTGELPVTNEHRLKKESKVRMAQLEAPYRNILQACLVEDPLRRVWSVEELLAFF
jgi:serine/threonine protein kinase